MAPEAFHPFFSGCVSVAGALIGLLFVAISVAPHKRTGDAPSMEFEVTAGVAFTALINALIISLVALLPEHDLGGAGIAVSLSGMSSVLGLAVIRFRGDRFRVWPLLRFGSLFALFVVQLINALNIESAPRNVGPIETETVLLIVCFLIAIDRAWQLLGGNDTGLLSVFARLWREGHGDSPSD
jgi:hypothetical protein